MSTTTLHRRLRQQMPWLTPPLVDDDIDYRDLLRREPQPLTDDAAAIPALRRPPLSVAPPPLVTMPTRLDDTQLSEIGAPPMVVSRNGRPTDQFIGEGTPEERLLSRRRALESYQPQRESKKSLALRTILNFVGGGIPGAVGTLIGPAGVLDRRGKDRAWQQEQLGQVDAQYGRMRADLRAGLQDDYLQSQIDENRAQTMRAMQPPPVKPPPLARRIPPVKQVDEAGNEYLADAETGEPLLDAKGNLRYTGRAKTPAVKPDTTSSQRQALESNIQNAAGEKAKIAAALASTAEFLPDNDAYGVKVGEKPNPIHQQLKARERKLDDDIRKWTADLGKVPAVTAANDNAIEQRLRDEAKRKNLDPEKAVQRYREGKRAGRF